MNKASLSELRIKLTSLPASAEELPRYLQHAARAAILGERHALDVEFPKALVACAKKGNVAPEALLLNMITAIVREGIHDLKCAEGEFLAYALIEMQDWSFLFRMRTPGLLGKLSMAWWTSLLKWVQESRYVYVDAEARKIIKTYIQKYDFDEDVLLHHLVNPLDKRGIELVRKATKRG